MRLRRTILFRCAKCGTRLGKVEAPSDWSGQVNLAGCRECDSPKGLRDPIDLGSGIMMRRGMVAGSHRTIVWSDVRAELLRERRGRPLNPTWKKPVAVKVLANSGVSQVDRDVEEAIRNAATELRGGEQGNLPITFTLKGQRGEGVDIGPILWAQHQAMAKHVRGDNSSTP